MCFEGAGYLPAGAGEAYGVGGFRFGHDGGEVPCEESTGLCLFTHIELGIYEAVSEKRLVKVKRL